MWIFPVSGPHTDFTLDDIGLAILSGTEGPFLQRLPCQLPLRDALKLNVCKFTILYLSMCRGLTEPKRSDQFQNRAYTFSTRLIHCSLFSRRTLLTSSTCTITYWTIARRQNLLKICTALVRGHNIYLANMYFRYQILLIAATMPLRTSQWT